MTSRHSCNYHILVHIYNRQHRLRRNPLALLPLPVLCYFPSHCSLLTWKPSLDVKGSCPPWSQVARKLTSPFLIPSPFQIPNTPGQLCALLRQHRDPGFPWSGTIRATTLLHIHQRLLATLWEIFHRRRYCQPSSKFVLCHKVLATF